METTKLYCQDCRRDTTHQRARGGSWICVLCGLAWLGRGRWIVRII
jgi:ribosomal protein L37AE/L43A